MTAAGWYLYCRFTTASCSLLQMMWCRCIMESNERSESNCAGTRCNISSTSIACNPSMYELWSAIPDSSNHDPSQWMWAAGHCVLPVLCHNQWWWVTRLARSCSPHTTRMYRQIVISSLTPARHASDIAMSGCECFFVDHLFYNVIIKGGFLKLQSSRTCQRAVTMNYQDTARSRVVFYTALLVWNDSVLISGCGAAV